MATSSQNPAALSGPSDAIRIVPVRVDDGVLAPAPAAPPAAPPKLTYRAGPLLTSVQVFTFFWGDAWQVDPPDWLISQIIQFFDYIVTSQLLDQMSEYSVDGNKIGRGANL